MDGKAAAFVFEKYAVVPRHEVGDQRAESAKLRMHTATGHTSVARSPFEAVVSGDPTCEWSEHVGKFIEWPAAHHGDGAIEPVSQLIQKTRQSIRHLHQARCRNDLH